MANLLAGKEVIKEFIQQNATPSNLATESLRLLEDTAVRAGMRHSFTAIRANLQAPATISPARAVLAALA
jgi:lipid-A-disaccharide synthase